MGEGGKGLPKSWSRFPEFWKQEEGRWEEVSWEVIMKGIPTNGEG